MPIYKGNTNQGLIYYGSPNTNCLTSVPKNVKLELTYGAWTQPIFSSNTNGGLTLSASHESQPAWYAFNGDKTTNDNCWWTAHGVTSTSNPCWIQLKSTIKLKLNQVVIRNEHQSPENFKTAYLQVSNDGSSWTNVATISGTNTGGYETTVNFTVSDGYYYYRLYFTESYSSGGVSIQTITFSGTAQNRLTLKAGSKVYVPNGFESDGTTPKFDEFITSNDIIDNDFGNASKEVAFLLTKSASANNVSVWNGGSVVSGTSAPDFSGSSYWGVWYDTANNIIKIQNGTNEWKTEYGFSLPICLVSSSSSAGTSLDQIFDWCGFIGSTAFVLPGVKGLIPNGFNAVGTYKNIEFTTDRVLTTTRTWDQTDSFIQKLFIYNRGKALGIQNYQIESESMPTVNDCTVWYNPKENIQRWNNSSNTLTDISQWTVDTTMRYIGEIPSDGTSRITSLVPTTVQPLRTGRLITNVYKGSTLVYHLGFDPVTFTDSGSWVVPTGIKQIRVDCVAAQGWSYNTTTNARGGFGGRVECLLNVTPNTKLFIKVGHQHTKYNDGTYDASDIRTIEDDLNSRLVVAGAGGGAGCAIYLGNPAKYYAGGAGGGLTAGQGGGAGSAYSGVGGMGGTQEAGGAKGYFSMYLKSLYAKDGEFGLGGAPASEGGGGGNGGSGYGGAGYYGGGGGVDGYYYAGSSAFGNSCGAAGGGSSYTHPVLCSEVVHTQGFQSGNGYITISMV